METDSPIICIAKHIHRTEHIERKIEACANNFYQDMLAIAGEHRRGLVNDSDFFQQVVIRTEAMVDKRIRLGRKLHKMRG